MSKDHIEITGVVTEILNGGFFKVSVGDQHTLLAYKSGRLRQFTINILLGDTVMVKVSPTDLTRGIIFKRLKK